MARQGLRALVLLATSVACNQPPTAGSLRVEPEAPTTLDDLVVVVEAPAADADGDPLEIRWSWAVDGAPQPDLVDQVVPADRTAKGEIWTVSLFVSDGELDAPPATADVTIRNTPPTVEVAVEPSQPRTTDDLVASTTPFDVDGDPVQLRWAWTVDEADASITADRVPAERTRRGQRWEVSVTPFDGEADGATRSAGVVVDNARPELRGVALDPSDIYDRKDGATSVVQVLIDTFDADNDALIPSIVWFIDGAEVPGNPDGTLDGRSFSKGQAVQAEVVVSDGLESTWAVLSDRRIVLNSAPRISAVNLDPAVLTELVEARPVPVGWTDEDGDPESGEVRWFINGRDVSTAPTLGGGAWKRGDRVAAEFTPFDGEDSGTPVRSGDAIVQNSPPTLLALTLSPTPARTDDELVASPGSTLDADGDRVTLTYAWTVNGARVGSSTTTLPGSSFNKNDRVVVSATPSDGTASGPALSASVTIANSAPEITGVSLSPSVLRTDDTAGVTFTSSDPDGDRVTGAVVWKVNGTVKGTATTLSGSNFNKGDLVEVDVTASDGTDTSPARGASVRVSNTAPTAPAVGFAPSSPSDADNVRCAITTAATDADGDTLSYTFSWTRNGSSFTGTASTVYTGDTVLASSTSPGDSFTCSARATDGTDSGPAASATVTVSSGTATWSFVDTSSDDVSAGALASFFTTASPKTSDYLFFEVDGGSSDGAWCSERADWYASQYVSLAAGSGTSATSGSWSRWHRAIGGSWSSAVTSGYTNYWGPTCGSVSYDWCTEWGLGGRYLAVMPGAGAGGSGESFAGTWSSGASWVVTVRVGSSRSAVCGF